MKNKKLNTAEALKKYRDSVISARDKNAKVITVCGGTGCQAYGCKKVVEGFEAELKKHHLSSKVKLLVTGCHGFCERGPLVVIRPENTFYQRVKVEDIPEIIEKSVKGNEVIERLLYEDLHTKQKIVKEEDIPFYAKQKRVIFGFNGFVDPKNIDDYIAVGGYAALPKALFDMRPGEIVEAVKKSGLRGRGGGGFLAGKKWEICAASAERPKYVVCNADEGDPGAYMDRSLLEGNPHSIIEGMLIGAKAIGANHAYVYVRNEYPLAVENLTVAIEQAKELGLLGSNILGSGFDFDITINRGGGAFVCGEETALIASLMGQIGEPHQKPPYPAESGVHGKPTIINNVETWANVPLIIDRGAEWFASLGTESSKGTKIFSLVGKINNTGLVEVPMGMTLREIVFDIGGGILKGKKFKAVQTGGPSGGCLPESMLDLRVDFDELTNAGSMMGSGGMIVMDEDTCMVDLARYFIDFLKGESCGKCTPCREGLKQMSVILTRICNGEGKPEDIDTLESMAETIKDTSICGLGGTAPNPVLSTLKYFRHEYEAHINDKKCPGRACKALIKFNITQKCTGCTRCVKTCPTAAITGKVKNLHKIEQSKCIKCGVCVDRCPFNAIEVK